VKLAKGRILIIDSDVVLLGLLQTLLEEAGCTVETISGVMGFTPELMALSRPTLVLLNPTVEGFSPELIKAVVRYFRRLSLAPLVLLADLPMHTLAAQAKELGVDGSIPIRTLLSDPLGALVRRPVAPTPSAPPPARPTHAPRKVMELEVDDILGLDLAPLQRPPAAPPPAAPSAPGGQGSRGAELLSAIEEEISTIDVVEGMEHYDVVLDVMGDANLYINGSGVVTGVFVPSAMPPAEGVAVDLSLAFPWGAELSCEGTVEWTRSVSATLGRRSRGGFGVRFPTLSPEQIALLQRFLKLRVPMQVLPPRKK
jgi:hypothetical protein